MIEGWKKEKSRRNKETERGGRIVYNLWIHNQDFGLYWDDERYKFWRVNKEIYHIYILLVIGNLQGDNPKQDIEWRELRE